MSNSIVACMLIILGLLTGSQCFYNPMVFQEMAQIAQNKASELAKGDVKAQLDEWKNEYPTIWKVLTAEAGDQECDKIRIDCFK